MEFCPGGNLDERLAGTGKIREDKGFAWALDLCQTLSYVHTNGIVHHDIKPQNILFAADGTIKLGDFGVANRNVGTRMYMPPEMLIGEQVSRTDPRVDVYSLGLTLLEALTGRHPRAWMPRRPSTRGLSMTSCRTICLAGYRMSY
jgi:serine/threonine protein kinase